MDREIVFSGATALAAAIRAGQVSATEVLDAHLAQIARHNPALSAFVEVLERSARWSARRRSPALPSTQRCSLAMIGLPFSATGASGVLVWQPLPVTRHVPAGATRS